MNKKGAEMTIGTIIIIVLALIVLVILVYGFSTGWTNLWEKITGFGGGKINVQTIVQSCQLACTTSSEYDYCKQRKLIEDADVDGKPDTPRNVNCKELEGAKYGLEVCDTVSCAPVEKGTCSGKPNPACSAKDNAGESECIKILGCKWTSTPSTSDDANKGACIPDSTILCSKYNDKREICESINGCQFTVSSE